MLLQCRYGAEIVMSQSRSASSESSYKELILILQLFDDDNVAVPVPSYLMTKEGPEPQQDCDSQPQEPGMIQINVLELL